MTYHVDFPGLGINVIINRVAFVLFGTPIYWYGICIALGMMLAIFYASRKAINYGVDSDRMLDVVMVSAVVAIIGARVFYVIFAPFKYESLWDMINLRDGGIAIYGGIIGAFLAGMLMCKLRKVPTLPMFDLAALGFLIGQGVGRWGNFFNQEVFGRNTTLPWGMYSEGTYDYLSRWQFDLAEKGVMVDPATPVHPTFLYESLWCLLGFFLLSKYQKNRKFHGEIFLLYIAWYGAERFIVEGLRTDTLETFGGLKINQIIAGVSALVAICVWFFLRRKNKDKELEIRYNVTDKRLKVPAVLTWAASEPAPTAKELKEMIEDVVSNYQSDEQPAESASETVEEIKNQPNEEEQAETPLETTEEATQEATQPKPTEEATQETTQPEPEEEVTQEVAQSEPTEEQSKPE